MLLETNEIQQLLDGYTTFYNHYFGSNSTLYQTLLQGQQPTIMVIACSDSRVDPALIFQCLPGELFVVRNVANLVPPCERSDSYHGTTAALEFAVSILQVKHII